MSDALRQEYREKLKAFGADNWMAGKYSKAPPTSDALDDVFERALQAGQVDGERKPDGWIVWFADGDLLTQDDRVVVFTDPVAAQVAADRFRRAYRVAPLTPLAPYQEAQSREPFRQSDEEALLAARLGAGVPVAEAVADCYLRAEAQPRELSLASLGEPEYTKAVCERINAALAEPQPNAGALREALAELVRDVRRHNAHDSLRWPWMWTDHACGACIVAYYGDEAPASARTSVKPGYSCAFHHAVALASQAQEETR